jgi:hypothetical protein
VKADPFVQLKLLDLQALDIALQRLASRRTGLPVHAVIAAAESELATVHAEVVAHRTEEADRGRAAAKVENDVDLVRARAARDQARLDSGAVGNAKELESLQHEIASLSRRQASLEDDELEILELREQAQLALNEALRQTADIESRLAAAIAERDGQLAELDAEASRVTADRAELAPSLPTELLALYDRLRSGRAGVGAAALVRRRCEGCHMELGGNDLVDVRAAAPDDVLRHEDCGRILVRTADSGL